MGHSDGFLKNQKSHTYNYYKPYENEVALRGQNTCLKYYQPLELMLHVGKGFRPFDTGTGILPTQN